MTKPNFLFIFMLGALTALGPLCTDFYIPALPDITQQLNTSSSLTQLTITAALFGLGFGQLFWGPLSDKRGRKIPVLVSLLLFILASIGCALSTNIYLLIAGRLIQGFAGAGGAVLSRAIARDHFEGSDLTRMLVLVLAISGVAPIIAPVLGGLQLSFTQWSGLFFTLACVGFILLMVTALSLKESHTPSVQEQVSALTSISTLMRNPAFLGMCLSQGLINSGLFAYIAASSYVFQVDYHMSPLAYSYLFAVNGAGMIFSSYLSAYLARRRGEKTVINYSQNLALLSAVVLMVSGLLSASLPVIIVELFITIAFTSVLVTLINSQAMQISEHNAGAASACLGTLMFALGGIAAPLTSIGGTSLFSMSLVIVLCFVCGWLCWFALSGKNTNTYHSLEQN